MDQEDEVREFRSVTEEQKYIGLLKNAQITRRFILKNPGLTYREISGKLIGEVKDPPVGWLLTKNYVFRRKNDTGHIVYFVKPMQDFVADDGKTQQVELPSPSIDEAI